MTRRERVLLAVLFLVTVGIVLFEQRARVAEAAGDAARRAGWSEVAVRAWELAARVEERLAEQRRSQHPELEEAGARAARASAVPEAGPVARLHAKIVGALIAAGRDTRADP